MGSSPRGYNFTLSWCCFCGGGVFAVVVWCGGVFVVFLWWWCDGGAFVVVVVVWWRSCVSVVVVVVVVWCFCDVFFCGGWVVFLWWWWCGGVFVVVRWWFLWRGGVLWWCGLLWRNSVFNIFTGKKGNFTHFVRIRTWARVLADVILHFPGHPQLNIFETAHAAEVCFLRWGKLGSVR